jgi:hypothetical protein
MRIHILKSSLVLGAALTGILALNLRAQETAAAKPLSMERSVLSTVTAKVVAIDYTTRDVTLQGSLGNVVNFMVSPRVERLNEIKVGDEITKYYVSVAGELRAPTEAEKKKPLSLYAGGARAPKDASPAAVDLAAFTVVATVIGLDLPTQSVTLQGPRGNTGSIRAENVDNLKKLHLGDTIILTYTQAFAISVEKK